MNALRRVLGGKSNSMKNVTAEGALDLDSEPPPNPVRRSSITPRTAATEKKKRIWALVRKNIPRFAKERRELFAKNAMYCKLCILDAFQGRLSNGLANNSKKSWWIYTIFCIQTSEVLFKCVMGACVFHTVSIFFEPENACADSAIYTALQVLVILIYTFDIALKMSYEGIEEYFSHDWQQLYFMVAVICAVDLAFNHCSVYSNPLRPVVGVLRARKGRRFFEVLKKMMPGMTHSLVPLLFFIVVVMVISALVFDNTIRELASPVFTSYNWFFLIFTNDNFNRMLPDEVMMNMSYLIFFFPCIYVGQQFLLSLIIGDTYETYKAFVKKQLKKEKLKEMQGLTKAFSALDMQKNGTISSLQWKECCNKYDPDIPDEAVALYFELLAGGNSSISVLQFLSMRNVLNFNLTLRTNRKAMFASIYLPIYHAVTKFYESIQLPVPSLVVSACKQIIAAADSWSVFSRLNSLDLIVLCFALSDYKVGPFVMPIAAMGYAAGTMITVSLGFVLNCCYLVEFLVRVCMCEGKIHKVHENNNVASHLFVLGVALRVAITVAEYTHGIELNTPIPVPFIPLIDGKFPVAKLLLLSRALKCVRITNLNKDLRNFSMALIDVIPALTETFAFSFIITYIFGALGNLLFGVYMEEWRTPLRAVVKAQQLTFMVDFLSSTEAAMDQVHPSASLFFVFYLILSLAVSNIALSIIIELQNNMLAGKTSKDRDTQKAKLDLMFNKIKDQARARAVFSTGKGSQMNFSNIVMSQFQSSDTRHFIADMDGEKEMKLEDIRQCQKYSNIDLIGHYTREHRNHRDQHWEVDFLAAASDYGIKDQRTYKAGQTVIVAGEPANHLFLVVSGSVCVSEPRALGLAYVSAASFIGQESLSPNSKYQLQCVADSDVVLLVLTQADITDNLDSDLCGSILRMGLKSFAKMEAALLESRKRASRVVSQTWANEPPVEDDCPDSAHSSSKGVEVEASSPGVPRQYSFQFDDVHVEGSDAPLLPSGPRTPLGRGQALKTPPKKSAFPQISESPEEEEASLGPRMMSGRENFTVMFGSK